MGWVTVIRKEEGLLLDFTSIISLCSLLQRIIGDRKLIEYKARDSIWFCCLEMQNRAVVKIRPLQSYCPVSNPVHPSLLNIVWILGKVLNPVDLCVFIFKMRSDSTCKWYHRVFVFLCLMYLTNTVWYHLYVDSEKPNS